MLVREFHPRAFQLKERVIYPNPKREDFHSSIQPKIFAKIKDQKENSYSPSSALLKDAGGTVNWLEVILGFGLGSFVTMVTSGMYYAYVNEIPFWKRGEVKDKSEKEEKKEPKKKEEGINFEKLIDHFPIEVPLQVLGSLTLMSVSFLFIRQRATNQWKQRQFLSRVGFSVHNFRDNQMSVRTLFERDLSQLLYNNSTAMNMVIAMANKTTKGQPVLKFSTADGWLLTNLFVNEISGCTSPVGFLLGEGENVQHKWYIFGLTYERDERLLQKKLRVLMIEEDDLKLVGSNRLLPHLDSDYLKVRWETLRTMSDLYRDNLRGTEETDANTTKGHVLGKVEIIVPKFPMVNK